MNSTSLDASVARRLSRLGEATASSSIMRSTRSFCWIRCVGVSASISSINVVSTSKARDRLAGKKTPKPRANKAIEQARKAAPQR
jgi:hypothetical protein